MRFGTPDDVGGESTVSAFYFLDFNKENVETKAEFTTNVHLARRFTSTFMKETVWANDYDDSMLDLEASGGTCNIWLLLSSVVLGDTKYE